MSEIIRSLFAANSFEKMFIIAYSYAYFSDLGVIIFHAMLTL